MKTLLVAVSVALAGVSTSQAQIFRPSVGNGAVVGAVAGGLIGGHNGDRWAEGAVIGGVAGALIGAALTPQEPVYQAPPPVYYQTQAPVNYGQRIYTSQPATVAVRTAPTVADAPMVGDAPAVTTPPPVVVQVQPQPQQQVVYVESAPRVVYVPAPAPRVYYAPAPVVSFGIGYGYGPRYYGGPGSRGGYYGGYRGGYGGYHNHGGWRH